MPVLDDLLRGTLLRLGLRALSPQPSALGARSEVGVTVEPGTGSLGPSQAAHRRAGALRWKDGAVTDADSTFVRPDGSAAHLLVVDDEDVLAELLGAALRHQGWQVRTASNGWEALEAARDFDPDVVVLDIQMPGLDGMETLERLRKTRPHLPVLFLTARDAVADRVAGLRAGADDYVTKPFDLDEVIARIDALLRRAGMSAQTARHVLTVGDLELDEDSHDVSRAGDPIQLTNTEFEVLRHLMENPNTVLSKSQILDRVWSYDFGGQVNVVELYVSYLRKKIEADRPPMIHTVRGAGYMLRPAAPAEAEAEAR